MAGSATTRWSWLSLALLGLGSAASVYLLLRSWALVAAGASGPPDVCSTVFGAGCDATLRSPSSWLLGVPLAGWGVVYYGTLAALLALGWWLGSGFRAEAQFAAMLLAALAALLGILLAALMTVGWAPFCPLCLVVQAINLALVPALRLSSGLANRELSELAVAGLRYVLGRDEECESRAPLRPWKVIGFLTAGLVGIVAYQWIFVESALRRAAATSDVTPAAALREFQTAVRHAIPLDATDSRLGPADAPAQLVVFLSFQCPACADLARGIRSFPNEFGSAYSLVVKHFPLGSACNPAIGSDRQPRACEAALAAVAAQRQGRFWPLHDALLNADWEAVGPLAPLAREAGLDVARFEVDRAAPAAAAKVRADIEQARRMGVAETPAVFLNGRRVEHFSPEVLRHLITHEVSGH